jgi:hypothetical protein
VGASLIEQYCAAVKQWAEITGQDLHGLIDYSMMHSGGYWYVQPEGAVEDPYAPEHRGKTVGELSGRYTIEQLRAHLEFLANDVGIMEDTLICGLICSIESEHTELVVGFDKEGLKRMRQKAEELQHYYEHADDYPELIKYMNRQLQKRGGGPFKKERFLCLANLLWKMSVPPEDEESQRRSWLAAWKRVTAPILEHKNLSRWESEYLARTTGWTLDE